MSAHEPRSAARRRGRLTPVDPHWPADPDEPPTPPPRREDVITFAVLNFLVGTWLVISPWVVGYADDDPWWNPIVCGIAVGIFGLVRATMPFGTRLLSWFDAGVGAWLFAAAFWLPNSATAAWNVGIFGVIVFVLALLAIAAGPPRRA
jgi:hypothetical protein